MNEYHLSKLFSKPNEGEYVPVTFIEFKRRLVGWSPELRRSVYIENDTDRGKLKRIREVNVMSAINLISEKMAAIELTDEEKAQFETVYDSFLQKGGQIMFTRKKIGAKTVSFFELHEIEKKVPALPGKSLLSEKL